jgi:uncharacterized protein (DUF2235 family)
MKRIIICADGTWNRPESNLKKDLPTNVLALARGVSTFDAADAKQIVFYDWGIGSYHDKFAGGALGKGLEKNVKDCYRFLVHNYEPGDMIYLFGFSRGAYTIRSLCGLINNCSILKSAEGRLVEEAFKLYKTKRYTPRGNYSVNWRAKHAVQPKTMIDFVGVWDTVGSMGLPFSFFGLINKKHLFYDRKLGSNIKIARHALSLDELRDDFEPTIWQPREKVDLKQVWFAGVHGDIGGGYSRDKDGTTLADIPLKWMVDEAVATGLQFENYFLNFNLNPLANQHNEYKGGYLALGKEQRKIPDPAKIPTRVHHSVKQRYEQSDYTSKTIELYKKANGGAWPQIEN